MRERRRRNGPTILQSAMPRSACGSCRPHPRRWTHATSDPTMWSYNTTLGGLFGSLRPDLIYASTPMNIFEIKLDGSAAQGDAQLQGYLNTPGAQAVPGDFNLIFKGASSLTLTGGWFGGTYTYSPSSYQGVVTYTYDAPELLSQIVGVLTQPRGVGGGLPLPPRLPPVLVP
jgi:hypothetical protein